MRLGPEFESPTASMKKLGIAIERLQEYRENAMNQSPQKLKLIHR